MQSPTLLQALIAHFDSVFAGPNGDYPAVLEALAGLAAEQAAYKPAPECNSIWPIVDHLTASKIWQIDILEKGEAAPPLWTEPAGSEEAWQASMAQLKDAHKRLKAALARLPEESLLTRPLPEWSQTQLELLLSIAAHEACHAGQIDYLKGLQARLGSRPQGLETKYVKTY
jgi:uncharacterized damage-inducible protein DinB